jgi:hypothetical protein
MEAWILTLTYNEQPKGIGRYASYISRFSRITEPTVSKIIYRSGHNPGLAPIYDPVNASTLPDGITVSSMYYPSLVTSVI